MIRYFEHDEIDFQKWDDCIAISFNGNLCAFSWYLDIVCPDWCALVENDYERVMPLPAWQRLSFRYLYQPFFTQQLGIFSKPGLSPAVVADFIRAIPPFFRLMDFNLNSSNQLEIKDDCFSHDSQVNYVLDLISPYEQIASHYTSNLRRNLKKAGKSQVSLVKGVNPEEIIRLFRDNKGSEIRILKSRQYEMLARLSYNLVHHGKAEVWGAYDEHNQLVGGIVWAFSHQKAILLFTALSDRGKELGAMPGMIDRFILEHSGSQLTLDFEGSNDENLGKFYAGFGAQLVNYWRLTCNRLPFGLKLVVRVYKYIQKKKNAC